MRPLLEPSVPSVCVATKTTECTLPMLSWATGTALCLPKENLPTASLSIPQSTHRNYKQPSLEPSIPSGYPHRAGLVEGISVASRLAAPASLWGGDGCCWCPSSTTSPHTPMPSWETARLDHRAQRNSRARAAASFRAPNPSDLQHREKPTHMQTGTAEPNPSDRQMEFLIQQTIKPHPWISTALR